MKNPANELTGFFAVVKRLLFLPLLHGIGRAEADEQQCAGAQRGISGVVGASAVFSRQHERS